MALTVAYARELLASLPGVRIAEPLSAAELAGVESRYGFAFNPDHRALLAAGLPVGRRWPDWRDGDPDELRGRLAMPVEGVLFDVQENGFWSPEWGYRPSRTAFALSVARRALADVPRLIPVYGHRYAPALPEPDLPVLSVMQTDVIVYGATLADYLRREFADADPRTSAAKPVPFWFQAT